MALNRAEGREPYREAPHRGGPRPAPARELVHLGGNPKLVALLCVALVVASVAALVSGSRIVEADCTHLDNELACDVIDSTLLSEKRVRARARDVTEARLETIYGSKGSKRSRLWLVSDTGKTPLTDWFGGEVTAQTLAAYEVSALAASPPPARTSFRYGSRRDGVLPTVLLLVFVVVFAAIGWQRVRLSHSPSEGVVDLERSAPFRERSSASVLLSEIDGVAIETVPRRRGSPGYRLVLVLKDLTRVEVATVLASSRGGMAREQRRLASWLGVATIG